MTVTGQFAPLLDESLLSRGVEMSRIGYGIYKPGMAVAMDTPIRAKGVLANNEGRPVGV
ncbi:hypothetical protein [Marinimicrobium sp. ABcell2]|uniref:hypothetical protein n=1 Tax=Marinimicrobium sp. ABcell2 TaxID=3069751 RepID=UPI0027B136AF|nr:hypothetical protein [Marinimicrobium sp. ABcell2]MDQ2077140.1 hypothetical protein [Marinimicrobium sp. ABcell2]